MERHELGAAEGELAPLGSEAERGSLICHTRPLRTGRLRIEEGRVAEALEDFLAVGVEATGARPRRVVLTGLDSLAASERRIAELASQ